MGDYIVHRARFFNYQPKTVQSMSYDDTIKKLAISRFIFKLIYFLNVSIWLIQTNITGQITKLRFGA